MEMPYFVKMPIAKIFGVFGSTSRTRSTALILFDEN